MASRLSKSKLHLDFEDIANIYSLREKSLRLFFSTYNPHFISSFLGFTPDEIQKELTYQITEIERDACLNLLAAIEALFRLDYAIRCEEKDKAGISRRFRELFSDYQYKLPLEDFIFEEWKNEPSVNKSVISYLKGAFKYRHWLAHGRYWILKAGRPKYDFYDLYSIALEVDKLPLKKI